MAGKKLDRPGREWFTKAEISAVFGVSETFFDRKYRLLAAASDVQTFQDRLWFRARGLIDAYLADEKARVQQHAASGPEAGDPLLSEGDSPQLERYRAAKADLAEMERDRQRGLLLPREEVDKSLSGLAMIFRRAGESLQSQFGPGAIEILNDAVDEWESHLNVSDPSESGDEGGDESDGGSDPDAPPADDA